MVWCVCLYRIYKHWLVLIRFPKCRYYSQRYKSILYRILEILVLLALFCDQCNAINTADVYKCVLYSHINI